MLQNRIYRGEIVHKDKSYPGQHSEIVDQVLWDDAQKRLAVNRVERMNGGSAGEPRVPPPDHRPLPPKFSAAKFM